MPDLDYGRIAYEAYSASVGGRSVKGDPLPAWGEQSKRIQGAWLMAAEAVRRAKPTHPLGVPTDV